MFKWLANIFGGKKEKATKPDRASEEDTAGDPHPSTMMQHEVMMRAFVMGKPHVGRLKGDGTFEIREV